MPGLKERLGGLLGKMRRHHPPVEVDGGGADTDQLPVESPREATLRELKRGYGDAVDTMNAVRTHIEQQGERSRRALEMLEGMPELIRTLPDQQRNQTALLQSIQEHLDQQQATGRNLNQTLSRLADATGEQERALGRMQENSQQITGALDRLTVTVQDVSTANRDTVDKLEQVFERSQAHEQRAQDLYRRGRRQSLMMSAASWVLAAGALGVAAWVAVQMG